MGDTSRFEDCITHGPWGSSVLGKNLIYMPEGFIKKISILYGKVIDCIIFQSHTETQSSNFGGKSGCQHATIYIHYPNEYLTSISGTIGYYGGTEVVMSIRLNTNQRSYGPYGSDTGTRFSYDGKGGVIVGFHGRVGKYIDAIGIYVMPKSLALDRNSLCEEHSKFQKCCRMSRTGMAREAGPWGDFGGKAWDDGIFANVQQVRVHVGKSSKVICGIQLKYVNRNGDSVMSRLHGGASGGKAEVVNLDGTHEYLTGISGFCGPVEGCNGLKGITCIAFHTNKKMYGPYGQESGLEYVYFTSAGSPGKVVGFHGWNLSGGFLGWNLNGAFLTAIGVHMEYF